MSEIVHGEISPEDLDVLCDPNFVNLPINLSSREVKILGFYGTEQAGYALAEFFIYRKSEIRNGWRERTRWVRLCDMKVEDDDRKRRGVGTAMIVLLKDTSRVFGASHIEATIMRCDIDEQPWLTKFYENLGFEIANKHTKNLDIKKSLV